MSGAHWVAPKVYPMSPAMDSLLELFVSVDDFCQVFYLSVKEN